MAVTLQGTPVYRGQALAFDASSLAAALRADEVLIELDLAAGEAQGLAWGCDLSSEYVRINADYHT